MDENDDELTIARECWPAETWRVYDGSRCLEFKYPDGAWSGPRFDPCHYQAQGTELYGIEDAERVLLERGLAEQYGRALLSDGDVRTGSCNEGDCAIDYESVAKIATAPLAARVKALAATIRSLKEAR